MCFGDGEFPIRYSKGFHIKAHEKDGRIGKVFHFHYVRIEKDSSSLLLFKREITITTTSSRHFTPIQYPYLISIANMISFKFKETGPNPDPKSILRCLVAGSTPADPMTYHMINRIPSIGLSKNRNWVTNDAVPSDSGPSRITKKLTENLSFSPSREVSIASLTITLNQHPRRVTLFGFCLNDESFELLLKLRVDHIYLLQCTFQSKSRMENTMFFLQNYQADQQNFEFLIWNGDYKIRCFFNRDLDSRSFDALSPARVMVAILPCGNLGAMNLDNVSCIVIQPSGDELSHRRLSLSSQQNLISIIDHPFRKPPHFILKDLCIDNIILGALNGHDSEVIHFSHCSFYSTMHPNIRSISDQSDFLGRIIPAVDVSWFVLSKNPPPNFCFDRSITIEFPRGKKKRTEPMLLESLQALSTILCRDFPALRRIVLSNYHINYKLFDILRTRRSGQELLLRDCILTNPSTIVWDIMCDLKGKQLTYEVLEFLHWAESFLVDSQLDSMSKPLNGCQSPHQLSAACITLPGTIPRESPWNEIFCLIIHSPITGKLGILDTESKESLLSLLKNFKKHGNLMLKDFLMTQDLIDLIIPSQPRSLTLENCHFPNKSSLDFSQFQSLHTLHIAQTMPQRSWVKLPWFLNNLNIDCSGPSQETSLNGPRSKDFTLDASHCVTLKSM